MCVLELEKCEIVAGVSCGSGRRWGRESIGVSRAYGADSSTINSLLPGIIVSLGKKSIE